MSDKVSLRIRNTLGQTISVAKSTNTANYNFAIDKLSEGVYFIEVSDETTTRTKKFVVQR